MYNRLYEYNSISMIIVSHLLRGYSVAPLHYYIFSFFFFFFSRVSCFGGLESLLVVSIRGIVSVYYYEDIIITDHQQNSFTHHHHIHNYNR